MKEIKKSGYISVLYGLDDQKLIEFHKNAGGKNRVLTLYYEQYTDNTYIVKHDKDSKKVLFPEGLIEGLHKYIGEGVPVRAKIFDGKLKSKQEALGVTPLFVSRDAALFEKGVLIIKPSGDYLKKFYTHDWVVAEERLYYYRYKGCPMYVSIDDDYTYKGVDNGVSSLRPCMDRTLYSYLEQILGRNPTFMKFDIIQQKEGQAPKEYSSQLNEKIISSTKYIESCNDFELESLVGKPYPLVDLSPLAIDYLLQEVKAYNKAISEKDYPAGMTFEFSVQKEF